MEETTESERRSNRPPRYLQAAFRIVEFYTIERGEKIDTNPALVSEFVSKSRNLLIIKLNCGE